MATRAAVGPGGFLDGVASGEPSATAVTFWSRLASDRPSSGARLIVARDVGMQHVVATAVVPTGEAINGTLKTRIGGLKPLSEYYYVWQSSSHVSPVGRTRTLAPPGSVQPLALGFSSCQRYAAGYFTPHTDAAAQALDLYVFLGDYIYAEGRRPVPGQPRPQTLNANDLASYRRKYQIYRSDHGLRELHRLHPAVHIWDDHEVVDDYTDNSPAPSPLQRTAAYRVAFEWLPRMVFPSERARIYKRLSLGRTADLFLLDERQYRTGDGDGQPRRLLGDVQAQWLRDSLRGSSATWKIIANQGVIAPMNYGNGPARDDWSGHPEDRSALLTWIERNRIDNVVFMSGDAHVFMANGLASDPSIFGVNRDSRPSAFEYVAGSVTSPASELPEAGVQANNPWNRQYNSHEHGYARVAADSRQLITEFRRSDLTNPAGATMTFERFTQPTGANLPTRESTPPPAV